MKARRGAKGLVADKTRIGCGARPTWSLCGRSTGPKGVRPSWRSVWREIWKWATGRRTLRW